MLRILFITIFFATLFTRQCVAQDTLPNISVKNYSGKIVISWKNNYGGKISTINIQRSMDSLKNFITFASVLNPMNKENGIVDSKPPDVTMFYRVFVAFEGGNYIFTQSQRPVTDSIRPVEKPTPREAFKLVVDSQGIKTQQVIKNIVPVAPPVVLGKYIFTGKDNNVIITLADATKKKYSIKFFDDKGNFVFEVKKIQEPFLILDKVNFIHAGLFNYELYDNGELLEKYRVIISKDIKTSNY
jgi:hypothetical protein